MTLNEFSSLNFQIDNGAHLISILIFFFVWGATLLLSIKILLKGRELMPTHKYVGYTLRTSSFLINFVLFISLLLSLCYFLGTDTYQLENGDLTVTPRSYEVKKFYKHEVKSVEAVKNDDVCHLSINIQRNTEMYSYHIEIDKPELYSQISNCK